MALKAVPIWVCANHSDSQLGFWDWGHKRSTGSGSRRSLDLGGFRKWQCSGVMLGQRAKTPVEDEKPLTPELSSKEETQITGSRGFHKDLNSLPRPLSATDLSSSPSAGSNVRIAYQGLPGAYSEAAALKAYPKCETVPCDQFEAAFKVSLFVDIYLDFLHYDPLHEDDYSNNLIVQAVELWLVDKAVLPIENSVGGSIHRNYDLLLRHRLHIVGEVQLVVNHCLLGLPGVRKEELERVLSHPQTKKLAALADVCFRFILRDATALDQCEIALSKLGIVRVSADDTAGAAQFVASNGLRDTGAVASARAAEIYGLDILAERIQDDSDNITRFLILAREPVIPGTVRHHKTSVVFSLEEGPGVLFKALAVFALRGINLSKIESRPQRKRPLRIVDDLNKGSAKYFDYLFYIDFEASMAEPRAQYALGHLQEFARFLRVLGCYPMDTDL
ncbi:hypothetical protein RJ640_005623 [Escallonia rubra]|uniref:Arogenate dehydratase n=1 Tax=Escallonia rubra TaxID=112253 RepID=A0AA88QPT8_9ASTE|nr:hypothetical protein RJ640_005623 [Escallonia rubra]